MDPSPCPSCGRARARLASRLPQHVARSFVGSRRRYCPRCRHRWMEKERAAWPRPFRYAVLAGLGFLLVSGAVRLWPKRTARPLDPVRPAPEAEETTDEDAPPTLRDHPGEPAGVGR